MRKIRFTKEAIARAALKLNQPNLALELISEGAEFDGQFFRLKPSILKRINPNHPALKPTPESPQKTPLLRDENEIARLKTICERCEHFESQIERCDDDKCGCPSASARIKPWKNRRTVCAMWKSETL